MLTCVPYTTLSLNCGLDSICPQHFLPISYLFLFLSFKYPNTFNPIFCSSAIMLMISFLHGNCYTHECCHRYDESYRFHWKLNENSRAYPAHPKRLRFIHTHTCCKVWFNNIQSLIHIQLVWLTFSLFFTRLFFYFPFLI